MKNLSKNQLNTEVVSQTNKKIKAQSKAFANETVTTEDILYSLKPLLDEYFVGTVTCNGKIITYQNESGQDFKIIATEDV